MSPLNEGVRSSRSKIQGPRLTIQNIYSKIYIKGLLTAFVVNKEHEDVHGADFCDLMVFAVQPKHLLQTSV